MQYKLLVLDLDGTLVNSKKQLTENTINTLLEVQEKGLRIALASGRPTYGIVPIAEALQLERFGGYILAFNGGMITNWQTKEIIHESTLPAEIVPYLYECSEKNNFAIVTYKDEFVMTEKPEDEYVLKEAILNVMKTKKVDNFIQAIDFPIVKCLIVGEQTRLAILEKSMQEALEGKIEVYRSEPYFLELVPRGIDKARSLDILSNKTGIKQEEMIACGDGFNDKSMIEWAGMGIAMANAQEPVKDAADFIAPSNDEDGVAFIVRKFILTE